MLCLVLPTGIFLCLKRLEAQNTKENSYAPKRGVFCIRLRRSSTTMPKIYPEQLVLETIACFAEEENIALTREEAIAVLDSFGGLFLAFAGVEYRPAL